MEAIVNDLKMALDPYVFATSIGFKPDMWQKQVLRSTSRKMILNCSRQSGKSTTTSILALHTAVYKENSLVLLISPSLRQSSELFRKVTDTLSVVDTKPRLIENNKLSCTFENKSRIVSLPSSEGTIRGYSGADLIIEDEASRVSDELYKAIRPMLAVSNGKLVLMSTPFGKRGHFFYEWTEGEDWERFKITAHDCPRITEEFLDQERKSMGGRWFKQEYECEFVENEDSIFNYDMIHSSLSDEVKPLFN